MPKSRHERIVHLSRTESEILRMLEKQRMYGFQIVSTSRGLFPVGTVYVTLTRLREKKLVTSRLGARKAGEQGPPRRWYKLTVLGQQSLRSHVRTCRVQGKKRA